MENLVLKFIRRVMPKIVEKYGPSYIKETHKGYSIAIDPYGQEYVIPDFSISRLRMSYPDFLLYGDIRDNRWL